MKFESKILYKDDRVYCDTPRSVIVCGFGIRLLWGKFYPSNIPSTVKLSYSLQPFKGSKAFRIFKDPSLLEHVFRIQIGVMPPVILPSQLRNLHPTKKQEDFKRVYVKIESI
ncbi:MAG: hypothetical protein VXB01_06245 [Opitutae bacterium]